MDLAATTEVLAKVTDAPISPDPGGQEDPDLLMMVSICAGDGT